jgi:hypothetical protein
MARLRHRRDEADDQDIAARELARAEGTLEELGAPLPASPAT